MKLEIEGLKKRCADLQNDIEWNAANVLKVINEYKKEVTSHFIKVEAIAKLNKSQTEETIQDVQVHINALREDLDNNVQRLSKHIFDAEMVSKDH